MERYLSAGSSFFRKQYLPHILVTLLFCMLSGFFVSFRNQPAEQAAKAMEMFAALTGILLFTPLFMPEQNKEIWLLEKSKRTAMWKLYLIRIVQAVILLALVITGFILALSLGNSELEMGKLWIGSFTEILYLGAIGFFISGITNQVVLGYMVSVVYFVSNIGGAKYFGKLALFQMMKGEFDFMPFMAAAAVVLLAGGIIIRENWKQ